MTYRTKEERARIVDEWRASGESGYRFARSRGLSLNSLKRWATALGRGPQFVRLQVAAPATPVAAMAVEVRGARVVVEAGFDPSLLRAVVEALS